MKRRLFMVVAVLVLTIGGAVFGAMEPGDRAKLLIIDETHGIQSSLQIELFAKMLVGTGEFSIHAYTKVPSGENPGEPYDVVVILPSIVDQVWIVTPDVPAQLSPAHAQAFHVLESIADKMYGGTHTIDPRVVVGVTDDLFPALYSGYLVLNGWL